MTEWKELSLANLPDWVHASTDREVPPTFQLRPPDASGDWEQLQSWIPRRRDSGILELEMPHLWDNRNTHSLLRSLHGIAAREDDRHFHLPPDLNLEAESAESTTSIPMTGLPVIGPGGRVSVAARPQKITADIVVRRRVNALGSQWLARDDVSGNLQRRIRERQAGNRLVSMAGVFGYFELSKYERQKWLRPALLISLRLAFEDDEAVEWADSIVEPVTITEGLHPADGLGSSAE